MSEPIFRAWDSKNKCWLDSFFLGGSGTIYVDDSYNLGENYAMRDVDATLCRSTGLKDRNGKIIFEFDIIKSKNGIIHIVKFNENSLCAFDIKDENYYCALYQKWIDDFQKEIIGSSLENPELLEKK